MVCIISIPGCSTGRWQKPCSMPAIRPTTPARRSRPRSRSIRLNSMSTALKAQKITEAASVVAAIPEVRQALMSYQRAFATKPPGAVLDGRDIGTVIAPGADVKFFVVATPEVRAARRALELRARGEDADEQDVLADLLRRDERDSRRTAAPLKAAPGCALARHHAFGYRRRIPGRRRYHRGRPNGPKAPLTALSSLEVTPVHASLRRPDQALSRSSGLGPNRRLPGGCRAFGINSIHGVRSVYGSSRCRRAVARRFRQHDR